MRVSVIHDNTITQGKKASPVTGSQPQVLEGKTQPWDNPSEKKKKNCLRFKAIRTYHHAWLSVIKQDKCRNDLPQPGLLPLVISLNALEKSGL